MLKNAATKLAHNSTLPVLGNRGLKPLQDLISAEKTVLLSLQKLGTDFTKASDTLKVWASNEGEELEDILGASSQLLEQFSVALTQYSSYLYAMREHMKAVRDREEALEELKRRRRNLLSKSETADKKVDRTSKYHKNFSEQRELANRIREQIEGLEGEIAREETALKDYKRTKARAWMEIKFGGLLECCEKGSVACHFGKLVINELSDQVSQPGIPRPPYKKREKIQSILQAGIQRGEQVAFTSFSLDSNPRELVSRARADSVSSINDETPPTIPDNSNTHLRNDSTSSSISSSSSGHSLDGQSGPNVTSTYPPAPHVQSSEIDINDTFQGQHAAVTLETIVNDNPSTGSAFEELDIPSTPVAIEQSAGLPSVPPTNNTNASTTLDNAREPAGPASGGIGVLAGGIGRGRGGHFASFPVKRRPTGTDRAVAQSGYGSIQGSEALVTSPSRRRPTGTDRSVAQSVYDSTPSSEPPPVYDSEPSAKKNSAIYIGPSSSPWLTSVQEDDAAAENQVEEPAGPSSPSSLHPKSSTELGSAPTLDHQVEPLLSTPTVEISFSSSSPPQQEIEPSSTPRAFLPSPRFSTRFTTKSYFEVLAKQNENPPPLPALPLLPALPMGDHVMNGSDSAPAVLNTNPDSLASSLPKEDNDVKGSSNLSVESFNESEPSTPRAGEQPKSELSPPISMIPTEGIIAPTPIVPNRVRFASNPIEIRPKPVEAKDARAREDGDEESDSQEDMMMQLGYNHNHVDESTSSSSGFTTMPSKSTHANRDLPSRKPSKMSSEQDILDLLNAATAKASSILATMSLESPLSSPSASPSRSPLPSSSSTAQAESAYLSSLASSSPSSLPKSILRSNPAKPHENFDSHPSALPAPTGTGTGTGASTTDKSPSKSPVAPPTSTFAPTLADEDKVLGRKTSMLKKSLPSSPYPQRRGGATGTAAKVSLSRSGSANASSGNIASALPPSEVAESTLPSISQGQGSVERRISPSVV
ncbi:hypothetical protein D9757_013046 [Collybiopsis confluens]|uniref:Eisosome component PIL1-domain-containing protein n=1 Tax=Collybiopsis confluens TaxID=2823264 RepID=A0A8H5GHG9_9AGAR|nr:hypothetical protein D9757_013046 [Collybiopsis confluens]